YTRDRRFAGLIGSDPPHQPSSDQHQNKPLPTSRRFLAGRSFELGEFRAFTTMVAAGRHPWFPRALRWRLRPGVDAVFDRLFPFSLALFGAHTGDVVIHEPVAAQNFSLGVILNDFRSLALPPFPFWLYSGPGTLTGSR